MSKRKLLLADDSVTVQKVVNLAFESEDIEVITADNGNSAFEKFVEYSPDLVMADINLPGANGYDICHQIKQNEETRHIPVLLLVGSFAPFSEEKAERVGAEGFLKKPFQSIGLLINKVTDLLDMNESGESESPETDFSEADTQPMPVYNASDTAESEYAIGEDLGETGMDDEMIETESGTDYSFADETSKYETNAEFDAAEETGKTQPIIYDEEFGLPSGDEASEEQTIYELADEPDEYPSAAVADFEQESYETTEEFSENQADSDAEYPAYQQPETAPTENLFDSEETALELDDLELLELPPLQTSAKSASTDYPAAESVETKSDYSEQTEAAAEDFNAEENNYSPAEEQIPAFADSETAQSSDFEETSENYQTQETEESSENYFSYETAAEEEEEEESLTDETKEDFPEFEEREEYSAELPIEKSSEQDFEEAQTETAVEMQQMIEAETNQQISQTSDNKVVVHYLPPEVIDEIAERVVEKLAEKLRR